MSTATHTAAPLTMLIDSSRCIDCKACLVSCKVANAVPEGQWRNWIKRMPAQRNALDDSGTGAKAHYQPGGCMQCAEAPCLAACPTGATYRDTATGVVLVDTGLCIGCGNCIPACPYGARFRHAHNNIVDKCDFCAARRAQGLQPACVDTCPTKARSFGPRDDVMRQVRERVEQEGAPVLKALLPVEPAVAKTEPRLLYINATAPDNWPSEPVQPAPMQLMAGIPGKAVYALVGLSALGALVMGLTQLRERCMARRKEHATADTPHEGEAAKKDTREDGHG